MDLLRSILLRFILEEWERSDEKLFDQIIDISLHIKTDIATVPDSITGNDSIQNPRKDHGVYRVKRLEVPDVEVLRGVSIKHVLWSLTHILGTCQ